MEEIKGKVTAGISLRDYFAGQALAGELATQKENWNWSEDVLDSLSKRCYLIADVMIEARTREKK